MKYLKIKIRRGDRQKGEPQMVYPDCYDAMEIQSALIGPIFYPNEIGRGAMGEDCILCVSDDLLADEYVAQSEGKIVELSAMRIDKFMKNRWEGRNEPEEKITDSDRLLSIQLKHQLGKPLTAEDSDAMDPDKRVPGINRVNKNHNLFFHRFQVDNK